MRQAFQRYAALLGHVPGTPKHESLRRLVYGHVVRVPFENVSKLLLYGREKAGRLTTIDEFLDGIEHHDLGGTCYSSNPFFAELLRELGYDAELLGADMNSPNVHTSVRVRLDGYEYHVDVGNASPFLEPIRLDQLPQCVSRGNMRWVFDRATDGRLEVKVYSGEQHVHGYKVNEKPHELEFFRSIVCDSFERGRTFMSLLRLVRIFPEHTVELKDRTLRVHRGTETVERRLESQAEVREAVNTQFLMPRCPVEKAVEILESINGISFFSEASEASLYA